MKTKKENRNWMQSIIYYLMSGAIALGIIWVIKVLVKAILK